MEKQRLSYGPVRENVPLEQYDKAQLYALGYLNRMFGALDTVPLPLAAAIGEAITPRQVRCMVREYNKHGNVARRAPFTVAQMNGHGENYPLR